MADLQSRFIHQEWHFRTKALLGMLAGATSIVALMLYFNNQKAEPPKQNERSPISFEVVKNVKTPEKPKPKPKPKPQPKQSKNPPPTPALADLGVGISGIDFGGAGFNVDGQMQVDDSLLGDTSNAVMTGDTVDQQPRAMSRPPLEYPARAMAKRIEGFVMLSILIDEEGNVSEVKVIEADPPDTFEEAAISNIKKWKFEPARYQGKPVSIWVNQPISFQVG